MKIGGIYYLILGKVIGKQTKMSYEFPYPMKRAQ